MSILDELSASVGDRTQASNLAVLQKVQADRSLLEELVPGLTSSNLKLVGDAVEVFTKIAENQPSVVAPYIPRLVPLLKSKNTRVRWEATHALALTAGLVPDTMAQVLTGLADTIAADKSVIVRNYAIQALGEYAASGPTAARAVYPHLVNALDTWAGRHIHGVLEALTLAAVTEQQLAKEVGELAKRYTDHRKAKIRKTARKALKTLKL